MKVIKIIGTGISFGLVILAIIAFIKANHDYSNKYFESYVIDDES